MRKTCKILFWITFLTSFISFIIACMDFNDLQSVYKGLESIGSSEKIGFRQVFSLFLPVFTQVALAVIFLIAGYIVEDLEAYLVKFKQLTARVREIDGEQRLTNNKLTEEIENIKKEISKKRKTKNY